MNIVALFVICPTCVPIGERLTSSLVGSLRYMNMYTQGVQGHVYTGGVIVLDGTLT